MVEGILKERKRRSGRLVIKEGIYTSARNAFGFNFT